MAVLGPIKTGAPSVGLHGLSWSALQNLAPLAAVVALVIVTQTAATTRAFAEQGGYDVDAGRDFLAVGAGSVVAGLFGSFPVDASPPRTGAVVTAGGRTQAGPLGAAAVMVLLIPIAGVLKDVPLATLAAVLIFIALRLFHVHDLVAIARFSRVEFALAAITLLAVVFVGVEQGIAAAVILAILDRIRLSARPQLHVLGPRPGQHQLDAAGGQTPTRRSCRACWPSSSPRRSGTPTPCTSARRWRPPWPGRVRRRCWSSTRLACRTSTSPAPGNWPARSMRATAPTSASASPGPATTCAQLAAAERARGPHRRRPLLFDRRRGGDLPHRWSSVSDLTP